MSAVSRACCRRVCCCGAVVVIFACSLTVHGGVTWQAVAPGPNATTTFENPNNWAVPTYDPVPSIGPELRPPGPDSTWFIEGAMTRANFNGTITLSTDRDGSDANHPKLGAGSIGGGMTNEITRLVIAANVTITGGERTATGDLSATVRQFRLGQQDWTDDDVFPWGIVQQTHGTVNFEMAADPSRGDLLITNDKTVAAGGIWEIGGDASLIIPTDMQMGQKVAVKAAGGIFRIRGSDVGSVTVGDRFQVHSQTATFDVTEVDLGGGLRHKLNRGKSAVEFVLDADGVTPLTIQDNLDLGSLGTVTTPVLGQQSAVLPAFLRVKLSEPTTKGMGTYNPDDPGAGDVIVLIESDRITSAITTARRAQKSSCKAAFLNPITRTMRAHLLTVLCWMVFELTQTMPVPCTVGR